MQEVQKAVDQEGGILASQVTMAHNGSLFNNESSWLFLFLLKTETQATYNL